MTSKPTESGRIGFPLRMPPEIKSRLDRAAKEDGVSVNDWLLDIIEQALAARDAEIAAGRRKADLERRRDMKFHEIVVHLAGGDITGLKAEVFTRLQEKAEAAIERWRDRTASDYYAEPRTPLERLCRDYRDIEDEIDGGAVKGIDSFEIQIDDADPDDDELDDVPDDGE